MASSDCTRTQIGACDIGLIGIRENAADLELTMPSMTALVTAPLAANHVATDIEIVHFLACAFREPGWSAGIPVDRPSTSAPWTTPTTLPAVLRSIAPGTSEVQNFALDVRRALVQQRGWLTPWALHPGDGCGRATYLIVQAWTDQPAIQLFSQL